jgi:hypothetical protein
MILSGLFEGTWEVARQAEFEGEIELSFERLILLESFQSASAFEDGFLGETVIGKWDLHLVWTVTCL